MRIAKKIVSTTLTSSLVLILLVAGTVLMSRFMLSLKELSNQTITVLANWNALDRISNDVLYSRLDTVNRLDQMEKAWLRATDDLDTSFRVLKDNGLLKFIPREISEDLEQAWYVWLFSRNKLKRGQAIFGDIIHGSRAEEVLFELDARTFFEKLQYLINHSQSRDERHMYQNFLAQMYVLDITSDNFSRLLETINRNIPGRIDSYIFAGLLIIGTSFVLVILVSLFSARKIIQPINRLASAVRQMSENDYPSQIRAVAGSDSDDEIGIIHDAFNRMAVRIHALYEESLHKERETRKAQYRALQYQINPHFLYNTLGSLQMAAAVRGDQEMAANLQSLSRLLRNTVARSDRFITVAEELEIMEDYIALIQIRYKHRLNYEVLLDEQVGDFFMPALLLQPLLENAVLHGLTARLNAEGAEARLTVTGRDDEGMLLLSVCDNGKGIESDRIKGLLSDPDMQTESGGVCIGLKNIHDRIVLLFGDPYGIDIDSVAGEYTEITVRLPILAEEADAQAVNR